MRNKNKIPGQATIFWIFLWKNKMAFFWVKAVPHFLFQSCPETDEIVSEEKLIEWSRTHFSSSEKKYSIFEKGKRIGQNGQFNFFFLKNRLYWTPLKRFFCRKMNFFQFSFPLNNVWMNWANEFSIPFRNLVFFLHFFLHFLVFFRNQSHTNDINQHYSAQFKFLCQDCFDSCNFFSFNF